MRWRFYGDMALRAISLFAGVGGLDLGVGAVLDTRVVCYVEGEAAAAATLVARMEDGALDEAPVWGDAATFDGKPWRGAVDCIMGGFPCQVRAIGNGVVPMQAAACIAALLGRLR